MDGFFRILEKTSSELIYANDCMKVKLGIKSCYHCIRRNVLCNDSGIKGSTFVIYFQWRQKCWRVNSIFPCWPSTNWSKKLTLSQPRGSDYAYIIILAPTDFQIFRRPWSTFSWFLELVKCCSMYYPWLKVAFSRNKHQRLWSCMKLWAKLAAETKMVNFFREKAIIFKKESGNMFCVQKLLSNHDMQNLVASHGL